MTKVLINDIIKFIQNGDEVSFKPHHKPTPLDFLELAAAACIGLEISKLIREENLSVDIFKDVCIYISNNKLNLKCKCDYKHKEKFQKVVSSCYISNKLLFEKNIIFIDESDELRLSQN